MAEACRDRPPGARPTWSGHGERRPARPLRDPAHRARPAAPGRPGSQVHPALAAHRGHPERPARRAHQEHPEPQARPAPAARRGHRAAAARPVPSGPGRPASSRHGEHRREACPRAGWARRARSAHQEHQEHREAAALPLDQPGQPDPGTPPGPGPTRAAWAHSHPPGFRAHPGRRAEAEACSPVAHPAFPARSAEAAAAPLPHGYGAAAAPPCWSRRPRCHRRSARGTARAYPDRPEAAERPHPADTRRRTRRAEAA
ncbi:hypothetical protein QF030_003691 [Streptomyces rishiriensis]|uniref:Uncharacterized protein n=1 Tax=Streptomyces rishiriensis TaxID=68264 RepID=A0ABU0NS02_STRRH|nr:hypothetical protein [Streptomyces rishiriensis]